MAMVDTNDALETQEFFDLMQAYRYATLANLTNVAERFEDVKAFVRRALVEAARDQRHACAEALLAIDRNVWSLDAAHSAVMNASTSARTTTRAGGER